MSQPINLPQQHYQTANQSAYVGVAGHNDANEYLRYKEELDRQRAEQEAAKRKAKAGWVKRGLVGAASGALTGFLTGGPVGAGIGAAGGFGLSALSDAAGVTGGTGLGGGQLAGGAGGLAYRKWAAQNAAAPSDGASGPMGGGMPMASATPDLGTYQLSGPTYNPASDFNFDYGAGFGKYR